jgi:hypothetical protein
MDVRHPQQVLALKGISIEISSVVGVIKEVWEKSAVVLNVLNVSMQGLVRRTSSLL